MMGDLAGHVFPGLAFVAWAAHLLRGGGNVVTNPWEVQKDGTLAIAPASTGAIESWAKIVVPAVEPKRARRSMRTSPWASS